MKLYILGGVIIITSILSGSVYYYKSRYEQLNTAHQRLITSIRQQDELIRLQNNIYQRKVDQINESHKIDLNRLTADIKRMRQQASVSLLPGDSKTGSSEISFDKQQLDRAIQSFRTGVQTLIGEGANCQVDREALIEWARSL